MTVIRGWTAALAQRYSPTASLERIATRIFAELDPANPTHRAVAEAVLILAPYYPIAEQMLAINAGLFALDFDEAEVDIALWRAEIEART